MILGISGKRGSGKSLLASYLEHEYGWARFSLADALKKEVLRDWKLAPSMLWGKDKEVPTGYTRQHPHNYPLTARDIMIRHGEYRRSIDQLYWCKLFDPGIGDKVVIDDIRFLNEVSYFRDKYAANFVRIERKLELNIFKAALDDKSENELDHGVDWTFKLEAENNVTSEDLKRFASYIDGHLGSLRVP